MLGMPCQVAEKRDKDGALAQTTSLAINGITH